MEPLEMLSRNQHKYLFFFLWCYPQNKILVSMIKVSNSAGSNYQLILLFSVRFDIFQCSIFFPLLTEMSVTQKHRWLKLFICTPCVFTSVMFQTLLQFVRTKQNPSGCVHLKKNHTVANLNSKYRTIWKFFT